MDFDQDGYLQIRPGNSHEKDYQTWMRHRKNEENIQLQIPTELIHEIPTDAEHRTNYNPGRRTKNNPKETLRVGTQHKYNGKHLLPNLQSL